MKFSNEVLAGVILGRGKISENPLRVSVRMDGPIPEYLHRKFGGTLFSDDVKHRKRSWFRVQGKNAIKLLFALEPYLAYERGRVKRLLKKSKNKGLLRRGLRNGEPL